jgi:hypothetical protein
MALRVKATGRKNQRSGAEWDSQRQEIVEFPIYIEHSEQSSEQT